MTRDSDVDRLLNLREIFESSCPMSKKSEFRNLPSRQHDLRYVTLTSTP
jgi:hypothetical protein